jgi:epoxyqueuosine reductase
VNEDFPHEENSGKVSRYAWGRDYHYVIWEKLEILISLIKKYEPSCSTEYYVDTGPVMDKAWAVKAGLGWIGKHSNVINQQIGSWFFIANIFTDLKFRDYDIPVRDLCGKCTACIDACPTQAIVQDYIIDSNKCISYLTIENKNEISDEFLGKFEDWIFGCDVCQEVCPWNVKFAEETGVFEFISHKTKHITFDDIKDISNRAFREKYGESPILRAKAKGMKRNADFLKKSLNLNEDK